MSRRPRRNRTPAFKAKVALAAVKGDKTLTELAQQFDRSPDTIADLALYRLRLPCRVASVLNILTFFPSENRT